ncbi:hypothetical protein H6P81_019200 [Aristolochia fimbriata]|uniref:Uncharacterized protein n=1 Tax=Aristolochia fimbriata TaxID=158543 RepID=A0AAV7DR42_ARIFI|nr:hypothetical protein H6P81_019200 [Aristolochia fimbriata]
MAERAETIENHCTSFREPNGVLVNGPTATHGGGQLRLPCPVQVLLKLKKLKDEDRGVIKILAPDNNSLRP